MKTERGVTLLEMLVAVSLVAILSSGMMMALRTSVQAYEKTGKRLEENRRTMGSSQILFNHISSAMAVTAICSVNGGPPTGTVFLTGNATRLRLVSSYSIAEGARGYPQIVEYDVVPSDNGTARLVVREAAYTGPESTTAACAGGIPTGQPYVIADHLAACRFLYHEPYDLNSYLETDWLPVWDRPSMPAAIRIEMKPAAGSAGSLPELGVTVALHVTRDPFAQYEDHF